MWTRRIAPIDPFEAAQRLRPLGALAFLDSCQADSPLSRHSYVAAAPFAGFEARHGDEGLAALRRLMARYRVERGDERFPAGAIGAIAYDYGHLLERLDTPDGWQPKAWLARFNLYATILAIDHASGETRLVGTGFSTQLDRQSDEALRRAEAERAFDRFEAALGRPVSALAANPPVTGFTSDFTKGTHAGAIETVRDYIAAGDIYQANIAQTFTAELPAGFDPLAFYGRLRRHNAAPFAAYLEQADETIASSSPERFLGLVGSAVETRPIKGTARRGHDPASDEEAASRLSGSVKDRAENVMIVDLLRNDLSRVCEPSSVEVPVLCGVESYASVHHLVSVVTGTLQSGLDAYDLVAACFPGGSITGAPKIRAMDIITQLENRPRGIYCGSIGYVGFDGGMDLNIAIRTVSFSGGQARFSAGGGITILSEADAEYDESLAKAGRLFDAFGDGS